MARLVIRLFGPLQVMLDGVEVCNFDSNKVRALLAYLVAEADRPHSRNSLAGLLWPDSSEESAQANLRHVLANLRKAIGDDSADPHFLKISRQNIQFDLGSSFWCDMLAFSQLGIGLDPQSLTTQVLEEGIGLYRGPFLEGFFASGSDPFEEWALLRRESLQRLAVSTLTRLTSTCHSGSEKEKALRYAWQLVELDPCREESWQQLIELLSLYGRRGDALAQYEACRRALEKELGVEPSTETVALYESIRDGTYEKGETFLPILAGTSSAPVTASTQLALIHTPVDSAPIQRGPAIGLHKPSGKPGLRWFMLAGAILVSLGLLLWSGFQPQISSPEGQASSITAVSAPLDPFRAQAARTVITCEDLPTLEICVRHPQTGWINQLTRAGAYKALAGLAWSPDGEQIVFSALKPEKMATVLYLINADGSNERPLVGENFEGQFPAWSPDGEWIVFSKNNQLWLVRPDGSDVQLLLQGQSNEIAYIETSWSRDSRWIVFFKQIASPTEITSEVWIIEHETKSARLVRSFDGKVHGILGWDPDGDRIACFCARELPRGEIQEDALIFDVNGQGDIQLYNVPPQPWFPSYWPQWDEHE